MLYRFQQRLLNLVVHSRYLEATDMIPLPISSHISEFNLHIQTQGKSRDLVFLSSTICTPDISCLNASYAVTSHQRSGLCPLHWPVWWYSSGGVDHRLGKAIWQNAYFTLITFPSSVFFHPRCTTLSGPPETLIALQHHFPYSNSTILHYNSNWLSQYNHPSHILASPSLLAVTVRYKASPNTNSKLTVSHKHKARAHNWDVPWSIISMLFSSCTLMVGISRHLCKF